jgi:uncharacterized protein (DUF2141 family)
MRYSSFIIIALLILGPKAYTQQGKGIKRGNIVVKIKNLKNNNGQIRTCLFNSAEGFPDHPSKAYKILKKSINDEENAYSDFYIDEFNDELSIKELCNEIHEDNYDIQLTNYHNTIRSLNEILTKEKFFGIWRNNASAWEISIEDREIVEEMKKLEKETRFRNEKSFSDMSDSERDKIKRLNRLILEVTYPDECPKRLENVEIEFENLNYGQYAIAILHDEDSDDEMKTGIFGIPKEGYGISNNVKGRFGPPSFNDAKISLKEDRMIITIKMNY